MYNEFMESELIMTENKLTEQMEMQKNLMDAMELMRKRYTTSTEEYFAELKKFGFNFSEEKIIEDYKKVRDFSRLDEMYYEQYGKYIDEHQKEKWLNSDVFMELMDRILTGRFEIEETGDPYFIKLAIDDICSEDLRKADQKDIEKILKALVTYSKTRDHHRLDDIFEMLDLSRLIPELIRVCHDRNTSFRALIRDLYECYEDMDPKAFPSVYREVQKAK
ncbi:MAG TPA: hypothetical protein DHW39_11205 [Erysipelotrichaceae bacterium]|nr:hypothetical protein [Erysipelotrichaceae bacterium]